MSTDDPLNPSTTGTGSNLQSSSSSTTTPSSGGIIPPAAEDRLKRDLGSAAETAKSSLASLKSEAETQVGELRHRAEEQVGQVAEKAKSFAAEKKDMAADQLSGVANVLTRVADEMEGDQATVAGYARDIANSIQRVSETVKQRNVEDIFSMVQDFGRRQPMVFLGAAALMGFAASRFIMSSSKRRESSMGAGGYQSSGYGQSSNYRSGLSPAYGADEEASGGLSSYGGSSSAGSASSADQQGSDRSSSSSYGSSGYRPSPLGTTGGSV